MQSRPKTKGLTANRVYSLESLELRQLLASNPSIAAIIPGNNATNVSRDVFVATDLNLVDVGVNSSTLKKNVSLTRQSDGKIISANVNTTGGGDAIVLTPLTLLDRNTTYVFNVTSGVKDTKGRSFTAYTAKFTTGTAGGVSNPNIRFDQVRMTNGTGYAWTSVAIGPDHRLYAGTYTGYIVRYDILDDGTLGASKTIKTVINNNGGDNRLITGMVFAPGKTGGKLSLFVSHGQSSLLGSENWSGKISKIYGSNLQKYSEMVINLPRSYKDHLTNQSSLGPDGALYVAQGSQTAMGAPDSAWGQRKEQLLSGAVLRLDFKKLAEWPGGVVDAKTEGTTNRYSPFTKSAPLTIYASGVRNAYDLVWTTDGHLYAPTNGSASGGNSPAGSAPYTGTRIDAAVNGPYNAPSVPALNALPTQNDYLFDIKSGGYYGHPNYLRDEYVLNGGNPTSGKDKAEVVQYPVGTQPDRNYRGFAWDFGRNRSPNGVVEYKSSTFGGALKGKLLVVQYSGGDNVVVLSRDSAGKITSSDQHIIGFEGFIDPVDIIEDTSNGNLYVAEYGGGQLTLLRPDTTSLSTQAKVKTSTDNLYFSDIKGGGASATQTIEIRNQGKTDLTISNIILTGDEPDLFQLANAPTYPLILGPGERASIGVKFNPATGTSSAAHTATLRILSDGASSQYNVGLHGYALSSGEEPSLQRLMDFYDIPIDVGDQDPSTANISLPFRTPNDEVELQTLKAADASKAVTIEPLATFFTDKTNTLPVGIYNTSNNAPSQLFYVNAGYNQIINPSTRGYYRFSPGNTTFGIYATWAQYKRSTFSEDARNTWDTSAANGHKIRFYPLKNSDGSTVANAYVATIESLSGSTDQQDVVMILRNVKSANVSSAPTAPDGLRVIAASGGEVKLDWNGSASSSIAGYNIRRSTNSRTGFFLLSDALVAGTTYTDDTVGRKKYYYRISAVDIYGYESEVSKITAVVS